jgi:hypothetical protein
MPPVEPKERQVWRPRVDQDAELNPSVRRTEPANEVDDRTLEEIDEQTEESEARENESEPIKTHRGD